LQPKLGGIVKTNRTVDSIDEMVFRRQDEAWKQNVIERNNMPHDVCAAVPSHVAVIEHRRDGVGLRPSPAIRKAGIAFIGDLTDFKSEPVSVCPVKIDRFSGKKLGERLVRRNRIIGIACNDAQSAFELFAERDSETESRPDAVAIASLIIGDELGVVKTKPRRAVSGGKAAVKTIAGDRDGPRSHTGFQQWRVAARRVIFRGRR
jgi:hypothetical protein